MKTKLPGMPEGTTLSSVIFITARYQHGHMTWQERINSAGQIMILFMSFFILNEFPEV